MAAGCHLQRQFTNASTNTKKYTISFWVQRSNHGVEHALITGNNSVDDGASGRDFIRFESDDHLRISINGGTKGTIITDRKFDDTAAWYHIVVQYDSTESAATDRLKLYVNGVQETVFDTDSRSDLTQDYASEFNATNNYVRIGGDVQGSSNKLQGKMSHIHYVDGTIVAPSSFGSTDSTTGHWKINPGPSVTHGNHGFFILKDGHNLSGSTVSDQSGGSNDFTVTGTLTKTESSPSNVYTTLNPQVPTGGGYQENSSTFEQGATTFQTNNSSSNYGFAVSQHLMYKGKFYAEVLYTSSSNQALLGVTASSGRRNNTNDYLGDKSYDLGLYTDGQLYYDGNNASHGTSWTSGDYIGIFLDLDNNKLYFSKNGTIMNTTGYSVTDPDSATDDYGYLFACCEWNSSGNGNFKWNFGDGQFGGTQLTGTTYSGANGFGIFKYDPTSITLDSTSKSFNACSTKGLNA